MKILVKTFSVMTLVIAVVGLTGCSVTRTGASDYLAGFSTAPAGPPRKAPIPAAVVLAIPETEAAKPTALTPVMQKELVERVRTNLRDTQLAISSIARETARVPSRRSDCARSAKRPACTIF